jgi:hypothetical protein
LQGFCTILAFAELLFTSNSCELFGASLMVP